VAAVFCFLGAIPMQGQSEFQARWNELAPLLVGQEVFIPLPGGGSIRGEALSVRTDSLAVDIRKVSGSQEYRKGPSSIPRAVVSTIRVTKTRGAWGRTIGVVVGQLAGIIGGGEFAAHVARSEGAGVSSFFAIDVGATVAGYFLGRARDKHTFEVKILPPSPAEVRQPEGSK
jgi:hypothetical protein